MAYIKFHQNKLRYSIEEVRKHSLNPINERELKGKKIKFF
jgi:hypothetical protein